MKTICILAVLLRGAIACAQTSSGASMKQLMLDLVHPASNQILLIVNRGGPAGESDWAEVRRSALTLAESGTLLTAPGRAPNPTSAPVDWAKYAGMLAGAGSAAYQAAQAKDAAALASAAGRLDASCTACHKEFRPNLFPRGGGSP